MGVCTRFSILLAYLVLINVVPAWSIRKDQNQCKTTEDTVAKIEVLNGKLDGLQNTCKSEAVAATIKILNGKVDQTQNTTEALEATIKLLHGKLDGIQNKVDASLNSSRTEAVAATIKILNGKVDQTQNTTEALAATIKVLNGKVEGIQNKVDRLQTTEALEATIKLLNGKLDGIQNKVDASLNSSRTEAVAATIKILNGKVDQTQFTTEALAATIKILNGKMEGIQNKVDRLQTTETLEATIKLLNGKLDGIQNKVDALLNSSRTGSPGQIPSGWFGFQGSVYLFSEEALTFSLAMKLCSDRGAHVVYIDNSQENTFITDQIKTLSASSWWIGITDMEKEGVWKLQGQQTTVVYTNWGQGEPNNAGGEHCAEIVKENGRWNDNKCEKRNSSICEKRL